jgi:hypothetical protein
MSPVSFFKSTSIVACWENEAEEINNTAIKYFRYDCFVCMFIFLIPALVLLSSSVASHTCAFCSLGIYRFAATHPNSLKHFIFLNSPRPGGEVFLNSIISTYKFNKNNSIHQTLKPLLRRGWGGL